MHFDVKPASQHWLQSGKFKGEYLYAERVAPFCYQLPAEAGQLLSEKIIVTVISSILLEDNTLGDCQSIVVFSEANWLKFKLKVESLPTSDSRCRRIQRLVLANASEQLYTAGKLDLSGFTAVIYKSAQEGLIQDDTMLLKIESNCIRMIIPRKVSRFIL